MTAKIDEIIYKLANFDYRKILPESTSPSYKSSSSVHFRTHSHKKSMSSQNLSITPSQNENLKVVKAQLSLQKKKARTELRKKTDKIDQDIKDQKKELAVIKKNLKILENKADHMQKIVGEKQSSQLEAFRYALKPLEITANTIIEEKKALIQAKEDILARMSEDNSKKLEKTEEYQSLSGKKASLSSQKSKLEKDLEYIKDTENCTYREFFQEQETKKILHLLKEKKSVLTEKIKNLDHKIAENEENMQKFSLPKTPKPSFSSLSSLPIEKEIQDIELYLSILCKDLSITPLKVFLKNEISKQATDIEDLITKHQYYILEEKEIELKDSWNVSKEDYQRKIKELSTIVDEQELELMTLTTNSSPDYELELNYQENLKALKHLKKQAETQHRVHLAQQSAISHWKEKNRKVLLLNETAKSLNDAQTIQAFKAHIRKNIIKPNHWKAVETVIDKYIEKIAEKDKIVIDLKIQAKNDLKQANQARSDSKEIQAHTNLWKSEKEILQKELLKIIAVEKMTVKKFENFKIEIDIERRKNIEKIVQENSSLTKPSYAQMQRTYGIKTLARFKEKEKEEVLIEDKKRIEATRKKIENILSGLAEVNNMEIELDNRMNEGCMTVVGKTEENLGKMKAVLENIEEKIRVLEETEENLNEKLNEMMEEKKKDIYRSLHKTLRAYGSQEDLKRMNKLKEMKEEKEECVKKLNKDKEKLEEEFLERVKELEIEEIKLKIKLSNYINDNY